MKIPQVLTMHKKLQYQVFISFHPEKPRGRFFNKFPSLFCIYIHVKILFFTCLIMKTLKRSFSTKCNFFSTDWCVINIFEFYTDVNNGYTCIIMNHKIKILPELSSWFQFEKKDQRFSIFSVYALKYQYLGSLFLLQ